MFSPQESPQYMHPVFPTSPLKFPVTFL